jgi:hypothetical protein
LRAAEEQATIIYDWLPFQIFWDKRASRASSIGVYAWGRIWMTLTDGETVHCPAIWLGSSSGAPQYQDVDAILKVTENNC